MTDTAAVVGRATPLFDKHLAPLLDGGKRVALLDFPDHANVGDSAIWLGQLRTLRRLGVRAPCYVCDTATYSARTLGQRLGDGVILLCGGGNLGDLWPTHQVLREQVLADFPDHTVVQLPQSIHFKSAQALRRARDAFRAHSRFTLLVRDDRSLDFAMRELDVPAFLCPDMALGLGVLARPVAPTQPVLWQSRQDQEAVSPGARPSGADRLTPTDWLPVTGGPGGLGLFHGTLRRARYRYPALLPATILGLLHERLAMAQLERGMRFLAKGRIVVTNRLHAHILCMLMQMRHYVSDNSYGKVRAFIEQWTADVAGLTFCESEAEALKMALAEAGGGPAAGIPRGRPNSE